MTDFFTADPHFCRREDGATLNRPFATSLEMSEEILEQYNSRAGRGDRIIIGGDFSFREPIYWRTRLRCRNCVLVLGNHDRKADSKKAFGEGNVREQYDTKVLDIPAFVSHYPAMYYPKSHYNSFMLHGHVHDQRTETIEDLFREWPWWMIEGLKPWFRGWFPPTARIFDIGVDSAYQLLGKHTLFSASEIYDILSPRKGHDDVEWYRHHRGEYKIKEGR